MIRLHCASLANVEQENRQFYLFYLEFIEYIIERNVKDKLSLLSVVSLLTWREGRETAPSIIIRGVITVKLTQSNLSARHLSCKLCIRYHSKPHCSPSNNTSSTSTVSRSLGSIPGVNLRSVNILSSK